MSRTWSSGPIFRSWRSCSAKSSRVKLSSRIFCASSSAFDGVHRGLGLLDERQDVAHAEDPRGHPVGVEGLQRVDPLADAAEHDGLPGDGADRQRRAAAGVPVELRQDDAVVAHVLVEALGHRHGVLPRHRVDDQEDVMGLDLAPEDLQLLDHRLVDVEAPGGVEQDRVPARWRPPAPRAPRAISTGDCPSAPWTGSPSSPPRTRSCSMAAGR